jgi:ABC-type transporter Mla MlaB component
MNSKRSKPRTAVAMEATEMTELVRGNEQGPLQRVAPLETWQDVCLDMSSVERIDAAGIAALISLYACARDAGHTFSICGVSQRVAEILNLVGLEPILEYHNVMLNSHTGPRMERPAA